MGDWQWMTASECSDWWKNLLDSQVEAAYRIQERLGLGADVEVGFYLYYGERNLASVIDMFVFDPLRLGSGTGDAVGDDSPGFWNGTRRVLDVVADVGRACAFFQLGKAISGVRALRAPAVPQVPKPRAPLPKLPKLQMASGPLRDSPAIATSPESLHRCSNLLTSIFGEFVDPAFHKGICSFATLVKALQISGRYHIRLSDLMRLLKVPQFDFAMLEAVGDERQGACEGMEMLQRVLTQLDIRSTLINAHTVAAQIPKTGALRTGRLSGIEGGTLEQVLENLLKANGRGTLLFGMHWTRPAGLGPAGHVLMARLEAGRVMFFDRTGAAARTLAALEQRLPPHMAGISSGHLYAGEHALPFNINQALFMADVTEAPTLTAGRAAKGALRKLGASELSKQASAQRALKQYANDPNFVATSGGIFGSLSIPVRLHIGVITPR
jgi:hypothetical protein